MRNNIIPEGCIMVGTIRTSDSAMQKDVHQKFKHTITKIIEASGAEAEVIIDSKTAVTYNAPLLVKKCCLRC